MRNFMQIVEKALQEKVVVNETAHPDRLIMFHGTNAYAARQIAKLGFVPDPDDKHFDEDSEELQSLPGSYFTNDLSVAVGYAFKNGSQSASGMAVIVAEIDLVNAVPDEDVVRACFDKAMRQRSDRAFVDTFHRELVGGYPEDFHVADEALMAMRHAKVAMDDDEIDYDEGQETMRTALDAVCRAYGRMAFHTNPRYLGGNDGHHTIRLPQGLGVEKIISIVEFDLIGIEEGDSPTDVALTTVMGRTINHDTFMNAVQDAADRGAFN